MTDYKRGITQVYVFANGIVVVFDQNDQQMPFRIKTIRLIDEKGIVLKEIHL